MRSQKRNKNKMVDLLLDICLNRHMRTEVHTQPHTHRQIHKHAASITNEIELGIEAAGVRTYSSCVCVCVCVYVRVCVYMCNFSMTYYMWEHCHMAANELECANYRCTCLYTHTQLLYNCWELPHKNPSWREASSQMIKNDKLIESQDDWPTFTD